MAAGLFASLFPGSSSNSSANTSNLKSGIDTQTRHIQQDDDQDEAAVHSRTPSDEREQHSGSSSDQDVVMLDVTTPAAAPPVSTASQQISLKEAQEVADVDMELSSPPSSPPPSAPPTPQSASAPLPASTSAKTEPSSSGAGRTLLSDSPLSTPTSEVGPSTGRAASASTPTVQRASRRRMMPARLSQVSSLLAGSMLEEELLSIDPSSSPSSLSFPHNTSAEGSNSSGAGSSLSVARRGSDSSQIRSAPTRIFTTSSIIVLTSDPKVLSRAVYPLAPQGNNAEPSSDVPVKTEKEDGDLSSTITATTPSKAAQTSGFIRPPPPPTSSVISTLAIKRQQLIETPDFKPRDDTLYMPKTRGLRSEAAEDTSDAAYERRHRKPETSEKRQRKAEVDRLSRDRQKLLSRIEQLQTVEARMLQPIVIARDQVRAEAAASNADQDQQPQPQAKPLHERIEDVRKELLADAYETLKRYDLLLSTSNDAKPASPGPSTFPNKGDASADKAAVAAAVVDDISTRSQSPRLKIRIKGGRATWETAESASPTPNKQSPVPLDQAGTSRRHSTRQPKHRVESLPTPLTAAAVEAVEEGRRKRRRSSGAQAQETSPTRKEAQTAVINETPTKGRATSDAVSPERRTRKRGSPEVSGTYKGKSTPKEEKEVSNERSNGRPKRAAAASAAVASARQRQYAERSFSDFDYKDEDEEVESAFDDASAPSSPTKQRSSLRRASHSIQRSSIKARDYRSPSASSATSTVSSLASSIGYMYPTVPDTGSLKVSQSLAEIQATDPEAVSLGTVTDTEGPSNGGYEARKKLKVVLSRSPSETGLDGETQKVLTEALDSDTDEGGPTKRERGRGFGGALTESEAESILAAFLGTTPIGKHTKSSATIAKPKEEDKASTGMSYASTSLMTSASAPAAAPEATASSTKAAAPLAVAAASSLPSSSQLVASPTKRRSSRRDTTQSFGEKLPDLLTKTAPFDFSVMGYFRSIDRPGRSGQPE